MNINIKLMTEVVLVGVVIVAVMLGVFYSFKYVEDSMPSAKNTESQKYVDIETEWYSMYLSYKTIANDCIETLVECQEVLESYSIICDRLMPARLIKYQ